MKNVGFSRKELLLKMLHSVHPLPFCRGEGRVEPPTKFSKRRGLDTTSTPAGGCWKRGGDFFQVCGCVCVGGGGGGCNFHIKNKFKNMKYIITKKVYMQKYFFLS